MKYTTIIQGGGARSIWGLGRLAALEESYDAIPQAMAGISGGALVCLLASCFGPYGAINRLEKIKNSDEFYKFVKFWNFKKAKGFVSQNGLRSWLLKETRGAKMSIPFFVATFNLKTKTLLVVSSKENSVSQMIDWVLASMTIPILIEPVKPEHFDGWLKRSILYEPVMSYADQMHVIMSQPNNRVDPDFDSKKKLKLLGNVIDAITWDNVEDDLKSLGQDFEGAIKMHFPEKLVIDYADYKGDLMRAAFTEGFSSFFNSI